jgi:hypothetical protein
MLIETGPSVCRYPLGAVDHPRRGQHAQISRFVAPQRYGRRTYDERADAWNRAHLANESRAHVRRFAAPRGPYPDSYGALDLYSERVLSLCDSQAGWDVALAYVSPF